MNFEQHTLELVTHQAIEIVNITDPVKAFVKECAFEQGVLTIASTHTTVGLSINEHCEKLQADMKDFLTKLASPHETYRHNTMAVDGRPNAHSHLLSLLLPTQLTLILQDGQLNLGQWQSLFAIELDGPRSARQIQLTLMGM